MKQPILNDYGFSRRPFGKDVAPKEAFTTLSGREAASMPELGVDSEDIMVLTGPGRMGEQHRRTPVLLAR
jgi:hypothetical protein